MATTGNPGNGYVTATEAGRLAGIPGRTVRHWAACGKIGTIETATGRLVLLRDVRHLAATLRPGAASVATIDPVALPAVLPPTLPDLAALNGNHPAISGNDSAIFAAALATELAAIRAERQAWQAERTRIEEARQAERAELLAEIQRERDRCLRAEWEVAQLRPLTAPPDRPVPVRRRRWWWPWRHRDRP